MKKLHEVQNNQINFLGVSTERYILHDSLLKVSFKFKKTLQKYKLLFNSKKKRISKLFLEVKEKNSIYKKVYLETYKINQKTHNYKDLCYYELIFVYSVFELVNSLKEFSFQAINFWKELYEIEKERIEIFREIFKGFSEKVNDIFNIDNDSIENCLQLIKNINIEEELNKIFNVDKVYYIQF